MARKATTEEPKLYTATVSGETRRDPYHTLGVVREITRLINATPPDVTLEITVVRK